MSAHAKAADEVRARLANLIQNAQDNASDVRAMAFKEGSLSAKHKRLMGLVGALVQGDRAQLGEQLAACENVGVSWKEFADACGVALATAGTAAVPLVQDAVQTFDPPVKEVTVASLQVPTLEELKQKAQRAFPAHYLEGCTSAACFFVARTFGRNDVIHVYNQRVPQVHLIDIDEPRMLAMKGIYPPSWSYEVGDAFAIARRLVANGQRYDVVTIDPFSNLARRAQIEEFRSFYDLATRYFMSYIPQDWLDANDLPAEAEAMSEFMSQQHGIPIECIDFIKRSNHRGGTYWAVLKK